MINALIFDFDGLILNTEMTEYISWQELFLTFDASLPLSVWQTHIGSTSFDPFSYLEAQVGHPLDRQTLEPQRRQRDYDLLAQEKIMPGVENYLQAARTMGLRIGLASSSRHDWVDGHLEQLNIVDYFDTVACRDDVADCPKPDPAVYYHVLAQLDVPPDQALALEDSLNGVKAAKTAGLWVTAVPNALTRSLDFSVADYCLPSLADMSLSQLLAEVFHAPNQL